VELLSTEVFFPIFGDRLKNFLALGTRFFGEWGSIFTAETDWKQTL